jgi:hypothetical protein
VGTRKKQQGEARASESYNAVLWLESASHCKGAAELASVGLALLRICQGDRTTASTKQ